MRKFLHIFIVFFFILFFSNNVNCYINKPLPKTNYKQLVHSFNEYSRGKVSYGLRDRVIAVFVSQSSQTYDLYYISYHAGSIIYNAECPIRQIVITFTNRETHVIENRITLTDY